MRMIKFRAWDVTREEMFEVIMINFEGDILRIENESSIFYTSFSNIELMQFTGILDKNGEEIYEGDFIYIDACGRYEVKFSNGKFISDCIEKFGLESFMFNEDSLINGNSENVEIIGNIYQNPELLKKISEGY